jgi:hypothetical protein
LAVTQRVHIRLAPHANNRYARVVIHLRDGRVLQREADTWVFPPLDALEWLSRDGESIVPRAALRKFADGVQQLESIPDVSDLLRYLSPPHRTGP